MQTAIIIICLAPFALALLLIAARTLQVFLYPGEGLDRFD